MSNRQSKTPLIYALEPRLLFDGDLGADIASAIVYRDGNTSDAAPAVAPESQRENHRESQRENVNLASAAARSAIVFIDGGVDNPQTLADAATDRLPDDAQIYLLQGDSNGFAQINEILQNHDRVDEIHIFGHGAAGEARLGTARLSLETLSTHADTLAALKDTLTDDGDLLLYGCDIAAGEGGQTFIEELAELTAADIAASNDLTGAGGDWELEVHIGSIEAQTIAADDYTGNLSLTSPGNNDTYHAGIALVENTTTRVIDNSSAYISNGSINVAEGGNGTTKTNNYYYVLLEQQNVSITGSSPVSRIDPDVSQDFGGSNNIGTVSNNSGSNKGTPGVASFSTSTNGYTLSQLHNENAAQVNSYLVFLNHNNTSSNNYKIGQVVFEEEILGVFLNTRNTHSSNTVGNLYSHSQASYGSNTSGRVLESNNGNNYGAYFHADASTNVLNAGNDEFIISNHSGVNDRLHVRFSNGNGGDFIRVITRAPNEAPTLTTPAVDPSFSELTDASAQVLNESGTITFADEDANLTISGPASATVTAGSGVSMASDLQTALAAAFSLTDNNDNTAAWTLSTAGLDLDFLEAGQTITLDYVVTATDANAETVTDTITATITGTNDAPVTTSITTTVAEDKTTTGASLANASLIGPTANDFGTDGYQTGHQSVMPLDMSFSANGQKLFVLGPNKIFTYNLTVAWNVGDWTYASEFDLSPFFLDNFFPGGVEFNDDGTRVFVSRFDPQISDADGKLISFDLSTAYDLSTASLNSSIVIPDTSGSLRFLEPADGRMGLEFSSDGLSMFMLEQHRPHNGSTTFEHAFKKFTLSTAWDISTADTSNPTVHTFLDSHDSDREAAFTFNGSGTRLFVLDVQPTSSIREYSLSTPYDISNLTSVGERSLDSEWFHSALYDIALSADESKLYLSGYGGGSNGGYIYEFSVADSVLLNDTDPEGHALTVTQIGSDVVTAGTTYANGMAVNGQYGVLTIGADGSYRYVADGRAEDPLYANETVTDSFSYTVSDGTATNTANLVVTVVGTNDAPTTADAAVTTNKNTAVVLATSNFTFTDVDTNDAMTHITIATLPANGALEHYNGSSWVATTQNQNITKADLDTNYLRFTPPTDEHGAAYTSFTFTVNDGQANSAPATLTLNITSVNEAPVAVDDTIAATSGSDATGTVLSNDSDPDGTTPSLSAVETGSSVGNGTAGSIGSALPGTYGSLTLNTDGTYTYVTDANHTDVLALSADDAPLTETFTYTITDGTETDTAIITVNVSGVNDAPTATNDTIAATSGSDATGTLLSNDSDPDGTTPSLSAIETGSSVGGGTAGSIGSALPGTYGSLTLNTDGTYTYVTDANHTDVLALSAGDAPLTETFTYTITDGTETDTATITVNVSGVNDAPVAVDDTIAATSGSDATGTLLSNDSDPDGTTPSLSAIETGSSVGNGTAGSLGSALPGTYGSLTLNSDGTYSFTVDADNADVLALGADDNPLTETFIYTITDGTQTDTAIITVNVSGVNDAPTAADETVYINERNLYQGDGDRTPANTSKTFAASDFASFSDSEDSDFSTIRISSLQTGGDLEYSANGSTWADVTENQIISHADMDNGQLRFTPDRNEEADVSFGFQLSDSTDAYSAEQTMTISVNAAPTASNYTEGGSGIDAGATDTGNVRDVPISDNDDADSVLVLTGLTAGGEFSNWENDTDLITDGTGIGTGVVGSYGTLQMASDGAFTYTANATNNILSGNTALDQFTFTVRDDETNAGSFAYDVGTLSFRVNGFDEAPVAVDDTIAATSGSDATGTVLSNDNDPNGTMPNLSAFETGATPGGGTAGVIGNALAGTYGSLTLNADGTYTYVTDANHADVLALGAGDAPLTETFTYTITDGTQTDTAIITVNVSGGNDAPVATNDTIAATSGSDATGTILSNDSDPDGTTPSLSAIETGSSVGGGTAGSIGNALPGTYGSLTLNADGTYTYVTDTNHVDVLALGVGDAPLTETFTYTITDGTETDTATITVNVSGVNDAPVAADDTANIIVGIEFTGNAISGSMSGADSDLDANSTLTVSALGDSPIADTDGASASATSTYGTLTLGRDGSVTYTADQSAASQLNYADAAVTDNFTYTVSDGNGGTDTATISFSVTAPNPTNTLPTAADNTLSISEDASITFVPEHFNFNDADGDRLRQITIVSVPQVGTLVNGRNPVSAGDTLSVGEIENLSYSPASNANGTGYASLTFRVNDGTADSAASYTMTFDITAQNDAPTAADNGVTIDEDTSKSFSAAEFGFADIDSGAALDHITIASLPTAGTLTLSNASVNVADDIAAADIENLQFTPDAHDNGIPYASFTFRVHDGTQDSQTTNTMTVNVTPVNDAPTTTPLSNASSKTDADYTFDLLQGATDLEADALSVTGTPDFVFTNELGAQVPLPAGAAVINGNNVEISPAIFSSLGTGEDVSIVINYVLSDGDKSVNNSATITISGGNTQPQIIDATNDNREGVASVRTNEDTMFTFAAAQFNFSDADANDTLSHVTLLTLPENGVLRLAGDLVRTGDVIPENQIGTLTFTPDENGHGETYASFRYLVSDGTENSAAGTMSLHVDAVNDLPTTENGRLQLNGEDEIALSGRNFAFADIEGDSLHHVTIVSAPTEGTLYLNNQPLQDGDTIAESQLNLLTYKPGENASGVNYDAFTFSVNDGEADSASAATITIGVNAAPVASDSSLATNEGQPKRATLLATDHDDANLQYTITKQPNHGTLELIGGGPDYIYTPDAFYYGSDNFKFVATDPLLTSEEAVVSVTVQPVNNAPMERFSLPAQAIMLEGKVKPIKLAEFFADVDAFDPSKRGFKTQVTNLLETGKFPASAKFDTMPLDGALTFTVESPLPPGLTFNGQSISGRPTEAGVYDIIMQATDGLGLSVQSSFQLFVGMPVTDPLVEAPQKEAPREDTKPEETISNLNEHDLPGVLKVNPKRDGTVPLRDAMFPDPIVKDDPDAALGNSASLADDAWMQATVSSEQDLSGNIRVVDLEINGKEIAVRLTDGAVDQAATFKGEMADGSKLPDWVQVDPNTGLTKAEPPQGAKPIEMLVIANDGAGNERAINLVLNPEALLEDTKETPPSARETRQERREARQAERQERRESRQAERQTRLEARAERTLERRETRAIRDASRTNTEFSVLPDGRVRFVEGLTAVGEGSMKLMRMVSAPEAVTIEITDTGRLQTTRYEVRQQDGTPAPDWVQVDAATGALIIEAPQNAPTLQLTLVAVDGTQQRSVDLDVDLDEMREDERAEEATPEAEDIQTDEPAGEAPAAAPEATIGQFLPLDKQIDTALIDSDYGQDLQAAIQARS